MDNNDMTKHGSESNRHRLSRPALLTDVSFANLMTRRIYNVLIVANPYDAFMLEDDGRIDEKIFNEYTALGLRYPPTFRQASTMTEAADVMNTRDIDLVICMPGTADNDAFTVARAIKVRFPDIPCVVLTPFSHGITRRMQDEDMSMFDYVFCWLGDTNLILSIIKLIEDRMNLAHDISEAGVQMVLLVEDSIRFYSSILPSLYRFMLAQSRRFATEALNPHSAMLRMRGRPKVVLARTYDEAWQLYTRYASNTLGVISDCRFPVEHGGPADATAGMRLLQAIRERDEYIPLILQSSETENRQKAKAAGLRFIDKNSKAMDVDLRHIIEEHMGFGDFIFRNPRTGDEVCRVRNLKELQDSIFDLPADSLLWHISRNNVSRWLCARAIFPVSEFLKKITWHELQDLPAHRQIIYDAIVEYRRMKNMGTVALFRRDRFDAHSHFARIGDGSLGGKGRGLAFLDNIIMKHPQLNSFDGVTVSIPKTVVLCTDVFDEFMDSNDLYPIALSDADDDEILRRFRDARLPDKYIADFFTFLEATTAPIAVRSSSLLEDSHYQPFAGVYSTYMIPRVDNRQKMMQMLADAVKGVYASVYFRDSKAYMTATRNVIDQEKMAVVLQELVGRQHGTLFYPDISGVLRSVNYYPVNDEKPEEGIASLALGLGKYIVDGGQTLRVCPNHPEQVMQLSETETALRDTQTRFYALDCTAESYGVRRFKVREAVAHGTLRYIASTYDPQDMVIRDGCYEGGRKIISFCGVLKHGVFPLPQLMRLAMDYGQASMRRPVEIEMACNINDDRTGEVCLLQIRPIVDSKQTLTEDITAIAPYRCLLRSGRSLGHGIVDGLTDVVYVKTGKGFTAANNPAVAEQIESLNRRMLERQRGYILIGPGRWGSSDPWLGIPVKWPHISGARLIVETALKNYYVEPSQGTHFFQNLTSLGVGYFHIDDIGTAACPADGNDFLRQDILDTLPAVEETDYIRHVSFTQPLRLMMDGMKQTGIVLLPDEDFK